MKQSTKYLKILCNMIAAILILVFVICIVPASDQLLYAICGWLFTGIDCKSGREIFGKENKNQA